MLDLTRQSGLIDGDRAAALTVRIVGVGAIGSHLAEVLAKTGIQHIQVQDFDKVEPHNLPNQGFYLPELGLWKAEALAARLNEGLGAELVPDLTMLEEPTTYAEEILVAAVDSMEVRKLIFESFMKSPNARILLDGRMGARFGKILYCDKTIPGHLAPYAGTLHVGGLYQEPCTEKSTISCAYGMAGLMGATIAKYLMEEVVQVSAEVDFCNMYMDRVPG